ncbi:2-keto-4-pentenoate hydratase [Sphaerotilus hippei]|uniref:2-keto-4-pentenoate hydratase n=1 Tax=Sphaerotilus hippei TaxID=744406 RepID=A0A318H3R7_9BURK|nr:fumarylacetoacetate hydrolase family protein [Sphaerotilus hippei]PXW98094.1 2-keto-4-pentenoate hydratase [Sphaerotilus hippei]
MTRTPTPNDLIDALIEARRRQHPLAGPDWADALPDAQAAYRVQQQVGEGLGWWAADALPTHWKSGAGSRAATLTHAPLAPAGVRPSVAGAPASLADWPLWRPGLEGEIALRLGTAVTPDQAADLTAAAALELVDAMCASVEVVDSRWAAEPQAAALLRLADAQSHGALVLGDWMPVDRQRDWSQQRCALRIDGGAPAVFTGTHPLGEPAWGLPAWLRHLTRHGHTVPAGTIVTTGTWTGLTPVQRGAQVELRFDGLAPVRFTL